MNPLDDLEYLEFKLQKLLGGMWDQAGYLLDGGKNLSGAGLARFEASDDRNDPGYDSVAAWVVVSVKPSTDKFGEPAPALRFFRKDGYRSSYVSYTWDGQFYEVRPVERTVTAYERIGN